MIKSGTSGAPVPRLVREPRLFTPEPDPDEAKALSPAELANLEERVQAALYQKLGPRHALLTPRGRELLLEIGMELSCFLPAYLAQELSQADLRELGLFAAVTTGDSLAAKIGDMVLALLVAKPLEKALRSRAVQGLLARATDKRGAIIREQLNELGCLVQGRMYLPPKTQVIDGTVVETLRSRDTAEFQQRRLAPPITIEVKVDK